MSGSEEGRVRPWRTPFSATRPIRLQRRAYLLVQKLLYWTGVPSLYVRCARVRGATILLYHSVAAPEQATWIHPENHCPPRVFERHMRFLRRRRRVVPIGAVADAVREGRSLPPGTVAVTFDDGYKDNLEVAAPILDRYGLPAVLYLVTGEVSRGGAQWVDRLHSAFKFRGRDRLTWPRGGGAAIDLSRAEVARAAYWDILESLIVCGTDERAELLDRICRELEPTAFPPSLMLNWDDVRTIGETYPLFEIGAHTVNHVDLGSNPGIAETELRGAVAQIEKEIGSSPRHFAFPFNRRAESAEDVLRKLDFRSGVGGDPAAEEQGRRNPYAMSRLDAPASATLLRLYTSGAYPRLFRRCFGRP